MSQISLKLYKVYNRKLYNSKSSIIKLLHLRRRIERYRKQKTAELVYLRVGAVDLTAFTSDGVGKKVNEIREFAGDASDVEDRKERMGIMIRKGKWEKSGKRLATSRDITNSDKEL